MTTTNVYDEHSINGVGPYPITFQYQKQENVYVLYRNKTNNSYETQSNTTWSFKTATSIELDTAPDTNKYDLVRIQRLTDVNPLRAIFYPGSAIRAEDLNADFEQLMMAIEEGRMAVEFLEGQIELNYWNKLDDVIDYDDQITGLADTKLDDDHIFTAKAIAARSDAYVQDNAPAGIAHEQGGKIWNDTSNLLDYFWDPNQRVWVSFTKTGPKGDQGEKGDKGDPGEVTPDAPNDGRIYGRKRENMTGSWVDITDQLGNGGGTGGPTYSFVQPIKVSGTTVSYDISTLSDA